MRRVRRRNACPMNFLPRFMRRAVLLRRARDLVAAGDGRGALALLADPIFDGVPEARELARAAEAAQPPHETGTRASISGLLAQLREERARRGLETRASGVAAQASSADVAFARRPATSAFVSRMGTSTVRPIAFRLAIDDAGEFLVVVGLEFTIGHESSDRADLRLLANIEREHARLTFADDFHAGTAWRLAPIGGARSLVSGRELLASGALLTDGEQVVLGQNSSFRFRAADMSSSSAVLELEHGIECRGAGRVLLVVPGADGRVSIGSSSKCTIRAVGLEHSVTLEVTQTSSSPPEARLSVGCAAGIARGTRPKLGDPTSLSILIPPVGTERFTCGAGSASEAPFEIVVALLPEENSPR